MATVRKYAVEYVVSSVASRVWFETEAEAEKYAEELVSTRQASVAIVFEQKSMWKRV